MFGWLKKRKKPKAGTLSKELEPGLNALFANDSKPSEPTGNYHKKSVALNDGLSVARDTLERVPKWTHPGKSGKRILCPEPDCNGITHVYNFSWSALVCTHCGEANNKYDWYLAPVDHRIDSRDHAFVKRDTP